MRREHVLRCETDLGRWEIVRSAPDPRLAGSVHGYAGFLEQGRTLRRREVAQDQV